MLGTVSVRKRTLYLQCRTVDDDGKEVPSLSAASSAMHPQVMQSSTALTE